VKAAVHGAWRWIRNGAVLGALAALVYALMGAAEQPTAAGVDMTVWRLAHMAQVALILGGVGCGAIAFVNLVEPESFGGCRGCADRDAELEKLRDALTADMRGRQ